MFWTYLREYARLFTNQNHTWLASRTKPRITEIGACSIVIEPWFLKLICPKTRFVITAGDLLISSVILIMFTKLFTNLSIPVIIQYLTCHNGISITPFNESCIRSSWRHYRYYCKWIHAEYVTVFALETKSDNFATGWSSLARLIMSLRKYLFTFLK